TLEVLVALDAFLPKLAQHLGILSVVPQTLAVPLPFLLGPQHRLVMRSAHHDAPLVSDLGIQRIVLIEGVAPHGGPKIVALQPKDQLKDLFIELMIKVTVLLFYPAAQRRRFVVEEDTAILHRRLAFAVFAGFHK